MVATTHHTAFWRISFLLLHEIERKPCFPLFFSFLLTRAKFTESIACSNCPHACCIPSPSLVIDMIPVTLTIQVHIIHGLEPGILTLPRLVSVVVYPPAKTRPNGEWGQPYWVPQSTSGKRGSRSLGFLLRETENLGTTLPGQHRMWPFGAMHSNRSPLGISLNPA